LGVVAPALRDWGVAVQQAAKLPPRLTQTL
jgi:hypothetical protein